MEIHVLASKNKMNLIQRSGLLVSSIFVLTLNGCASNKVNTRSETDLMVDQVIESTYQNVKSLTGTYSKNKNNATSATDTVDQKLLPDVLKSKLDVKWYGEAEVVLKDMADALGESVSFSTVGPKPSYPHDVYLNFSSVEFFKILEDIGFQLPKNIILNVVIDPFIKDQVKIELQYHDE